MNYRKSLLTLTQTIVYLRMSIHSVCRLTFPTQERVNSLLSLLTAFMACPCPTANTWMTLLGHMASLIHLVPGSRLRMRALQQHLRLHWDRRDDDSVPIAWPPSMQADLLWWGRELHLFRGRELLSTSPDFHLFTDASTMGWGCSLLHYTAGERWSPEESTLHINILELLAVENALRHFLPILRGHTVGIYSDNTTALAYLKFQGGTRSASLNLVAQRVLRWAEKHRIAIKTHFLSGLQNVVADSIRRKGQILPTVDTPS